MSSSHSNKVHSSWAVVSPLNKSVKTVFIKLQNYKSTIFTFKDGIKENSLAVLLLQILTKLQRAYFDGCV